MLERWTEIKPLLAELAAMDSDKQHQCLGRIADPALRREIADFLSIDDSALEVLQRPLTHLVPGAVD
ncbi:MAG: hypothetical protein QNK37_21170 [Acidobacteriota bacterium]|nr:hypothetical protein [Acidobacteriota bacterium]